MKRVIVTLILLTACIGLKAQNCEALILPYFGNDQSKLAMCPADKQEYYCAVARAAFYESDTIPTGAEVFNIEEVTPNPGMQPLSPDMVVDLNTLSYFGYNFINYQVRHSNAEQIVCFATPSSTHPYLVLRSYGDMMDIANSIWSIK